MDFDARGYGPEVKRMAGELASVGVATLDIPAPAPVGSEYARIKSRAYGYARSLSKIFDRPVYQYEHNPDESGDRFLAFSFE